jgi:hypothetical protein
LRDYNPGGLFTVKARHPDGSETATVVRGHSAADALADRLIDEGCYVRILKGQVQEEGDVHGPGGSDAG